ncbi:nuclear transport factor 2 family protein [Dyadobacter bucti]|uniref:nuclear transport factor 2 family protein n=1 Tax=Dyadobacter bucti TaxID=2572203 RepID=UPI001109C50A|nr:nuclear transport factor 2 family protein [Dyadobacter bucti]
MNQVTYKISSEREIENLVARYTHLLDKGDFAGVGALFAHGRIGSLGEFTEGADIESMLKSNLQVYSNGTPQTAHITTNTVIKINEDETSATAKSYLIIFQQDVERSFPLQPVMTGTYDDIFARIDGQWHFKERSLSMGFAGDLSHHANPDGPSAKILKDNE